MKNIPRKKLPKELAVINADNCTGCEACLEVCPVDCIIKIQQNDKFHNLQSWCEIDLDKCVGCQLCVRIPGKKSNPYDLKVCPWDAIEMVPTEKVPEVVSQIGGPPNYVENNYDRLVDVAMKLATDKIQNS
jgi:electron transport complex protein RnfB